MWAFYNYFIAVENVNDMIRIVFVALFVANRITRLLVKHFGKPDLTLKRK